MDNCLITKLKGSVNNTTLPVFGELNIDFSDSSTSNSKVMYIIGSKVKFSKDVYVNNNLVSAGTEVTMTASSNLKLAVAGDCRITVVDKYSIVRLNVSKDAGTTVAVNDVDIADLKYCDKMERLMTSVKGDFSLLRNNSVIIELNLYSNEGIEIPIDILNTMSSLTVLRMHSKITLSGNLSLLPTQLTTLGIYNNILTETDIATIASRCTNLTSFITAYTAYAGIISFAAAQVASGRTSGTCTYYRLEYAAKTIKYGTSMVNPTEDDTNKGYQIV